MSAIWGINIAIKPSKGLISFLLGTTFCLVQIAQIMVTIPPNKKRIEAIRRGGASTRPAFNATAFPPHKVERNKANQVPFGVNVIRASVLCGFGKWSFWLDFVIELQYFTRSQIS